MPTTRRLAATELAALYDLPRRLYGSDPSWVAPLQLVERRRLRGFVDAGRLVAFVAEQDGQVVGTISALRDRGYEEHKGERVAWFGYFEAVDDPDVAHALVDCVLQQAAAWGCDRVRGPRNLTRFEAMGLTVQGHHTLPPFLQAHHPPTYEALLTGSGFAPHHDVLAYDTPTVNPDGSRRQLPEPLFSKARDCAIDGLQVRAARRWRLGADLRAAHHVLNAAYQTVPDVSPMPLGQFLAIGRTYLTVANPRLLQLATVHGEPVAFAATFPELNEAIQPMRGRVLPLGWLAAARASRRIRTASFKLIGVLPEYRGTGLHALLVDQVIEGVQQAGYTRLEASVIDERNGPMRAVVEGAGMQVYRRYRLYERAT